MVFLEFAFMLNST